MIRRIRSLYRRIFHPNGPWWLALRVSSVNLIMALSGCTYEHALLEQQRLDEARLRCWLEGWR